MIAALPLALALMWSLAGCGFSHPSAGPQALRLPLYTHGGLPDGILEPSRFSATTPVAYASMTNAGLMKFGPDMHVIPDLAVSIPTISHGGRTYTFTIRQDARFASGARCTAVDLARAWVHTLQDPRRSPLVWRYLGEITGAGAVSRYESNTLSGVEVIHRLTVRINLLRPDATFLQKLAFPVAAIYRVSAGRIWRMGAWTLADRGKDGSYVFRPRRHYYGGQLELPRIELLPVGSAARAATLYRHNQLDVVRVPAQSFAADQNLTDFHGSGSLDAYYAEAAPSARPQLVSALGSGRLTRGLPESVSALASVVPPAVPDYLGSTLTSDPPAAGGAASGRAVALGSHDPTARAVAAAVNSDIRTRRSASPVRVLHESFLLPDPGIWLSLALSRTRSSWLRRELAHANSLTLDPVTRMSIYNRVEGWVLQQGFVTPLASGNLAFLIKPRVQGLQVTPLGIMPDNNDWSTVSLQ